MNNGKLTQAILDELLRRYQLLCEPILKLDDENISGQIMYWLEAHPEHTLAFKALLHQAVQDHIAAIHSYGVLLHYLGVQPPAKIKPTPFMKKLIDDEDQTE